jgi:hypothetical protein
MRVILGAAIFGGILALGACTGKPSLEDRALSEMELNLEEFFTGDLVAYGQFQDIFGTVRNRFEVQIKGTWDGQVLTLVEDFVYDDASTEQRIWSLRKTRGEKDEQTWVGTAPGVIGEARGVESGDAFNWQYTIDLPTGEGETTRVRFDDWMWLLSDDRLLNKAYMKRYGLDIGDVVITFEKL